MPIPSPKLAKKILEEAKLRLEKEEERQKSVLAIEAEKVKAKAFEERREKLIVKKILDSASARALEGYLFLELKGPISKLSKKLLHDYGYSLILTSSYIEAEHVRLEDRLSYLASSYRTHLDFMKQEAVTTVSEGMGSIYSVAHIKSVLVPLIFEGLEEPLSNNRILDSLTIFEEWETKLYRQDPMYKLVPMLDQNRRQKLKNMLGDLKIDRIFQVNHNHLSVCVDCLLEMIDVLKCMRSSDSELLKQIQSLPRNAEILMWDHPKRVKITDSSAVHAWTLNWLASNYGQEFLAEVDFSVKGSARAGLDSVTVEFPVLRGARVRSPDSDQLLIIFKSLGFVPKIINKSITLSWS